MRNRYPHRGPPIHKEVLLGYGDGSEEGLTEAEAPWSQLSGVHRPFFTREERVGTVSNLSGDSMGLFENYDREATLVENPLTGKTRFISRKSISNFFTSHLPKFPVEPTWDYQEVRRGRAAGVLEQRESRALHFDIDEEIKKRHGDPKHPLAFKHPQIGYKPKITRQQDI